MSTGLAGGGAEVEDVDAVAAFAAGFCLGMDSVLMSREVNARTYMIQGSGSRPSGMSSCGLLPAIAC